MKRKSIVKKANKRTLRSCDDFFVEMLGYCAELTDIPLIDGKLKVYKGKTKI